MRSPMFSIPSASLAVVVALSGCASAAPEAAVDATTSTTVRATAPSTTAPTTTATAPAPTTTAPAEPSTTTTEGEPDVLTTTGVVIDVAGNLTATTAVTILDGDGMQIVFIPAADATFHGGPVSHIRDHLLSGLPVIVDYVVLADGTFEAISFDDH
ncbi:MAG TPA: hypothetical protein VLA29_10955 [Acidimicrobiia bacterium]|nr:hypothetical protein [Acidimicrobiia bacterium]